MCWQFPKVMIEKLFDQAHCLVWQHHSLLHCLVWQHHSHSTQFKFQVILFIICINLADC